MDAAAPYPPPYLPPHAALAGDVDLWNRLASWFGGRFALPGGATAVARPGEAPPPGRLGFRVEVAPGAAVLAVPAEVPFEALAGTALAVDDLPSLPAALRDALLEGIAASLMALVPAPAGPPPRQTGRGPWLDLAGDAAAMGWFRMALDGWEGAGGAVDVGVGAGALAAAFGAGGYPRPARRPLWPGLGARLAVVLHESLGRIELPAADLAALAPGCVVVLPAGLDPARTRRLRGEGLAFDLVREGADWTCAAVGEADGPRPARLPRQTADDRHGTSEHAMDDAETPHRAPSALSLAGLPMAVDLDLGRVTASLAEIEGWQPGSVVPLDATDLDAGVEVVLRVAGRAIAAGDLVRLDDRLGVRLSRVALD